MSLEKRFPSETALDKLTFLNDKKVDGELYAYLLSKARGVQKETRVYKSSLPSQTAIGQEISPNKPMYRKTVSAHIKYLLDKEYLADMGEYYLIFKPYPYIGISPEVLQFLLDTVKEGVIKLFIYLCARQSWAESRKTPYDFTMKELCEHLGVEYHSREKINNWLIALEKFDLISTTIVYKDKLPYYRLLKVEKQIPPSKCNQEY